MPHSLDADQLRAHTAAMRRLARALCRDDADADDVVQDAWALALARPERPGFALGAWLRGVVRNVARDKIRARRRRDEVERAAPPAEPAPADDLVERIDLLRDLLTHVEQLDEPFRSAVGRCYLDGVSPSELARQLGVPAATVRTRLHRGIRQLRDAMDRTQRGGPGDGWRAALMPFAWAADGPSTAALTGALQRATGHPVGHAAHHPAPAAAAGGTSTTAATATATLLMKKQTLAILGLLAVGGALTILPFGGNRAAPEGFDPTHPAPRSEVNPATPRRAVDDTPDGPADAGPERVVVQRPDPGAEASANGLRAIEVAGVVRTLAGLPVADAEVSTLIAQTALGPKGGPKGGKPVPRDGGRARGAARTAADGRFTLVCEATALEEATIHLAARAAGYATGLAQLTVAANVSSARVDVVLSTAYVLRGRVVDPEKTPVAGAAVRTFRPGEEVAETDDDGRFEIADLDARASHHFVYATADGFLGQGRWVETEKVAVPAIGAPADAARELVLALRRGSGVFGVVTDPAGHPIRGVRLYMGAQKSLDKAIAETTSDEGGNFLFDAINPGPNTLAAIHPEYATQFVDVDVPKAGQRTEVLVSLEPGHHIRGVVRSRAGGPIEGAEVIAFYQAAPIADVASGEDGTFDLQGMPRDEVWVHVRAPGHLMSSLRIPRSDGPPIDIALTPASKIAGTVVDAVTGLPLTEFSVRFLPPDERAPRASKPDPAVRVESKLDVADPGVELYAGRSFRSEDGTWDTGDALLTEGFSADVEVRADGYAATVVEAMVARPRATPADRIIALSRGLTLRGRVLGADGSAIVGASLRRPPDPGEARTAPRGGGKGGSGGAKDGGSGVLARTGAGGLFEIDNLSPGVLPLVIEDDDWGVHAESITLPALVDVHEVELVMPRGATLDGRVLDADGRPDAGSRVMLEAVEVANASPPARLTTTDKDGRFRFEHLPPGVFRAGLAPGKGTKDGQPPAPPVSKFVQIPADGSATVLLQPRGGATVVGPVTVTTFAGEVGPTPTWFGMRWEPTGEDALPWSERRSGGETYALGSELRLGPLEAGPTRLVVHTIDKSSGSTYRSSYDVVVPPSGELELDFVLEQVEPDRERR